MGLPHPEYACFQIAFRRLLVVLEGESPNPNHLYRGFPFRLDPREF